MTLLEDLAIDPVPGAQIVSHRSDRFAGESQTGAVHELVPECVEGLRWMYDWLRAVGDRATSGVRKAAGADDFGPLLTADAVDRLIEASQALRPVDASTRMTWILHDLRGGALIHIIALAEALLADSDANARESLALLARDHAKVMRHSLVGLDEDRRRLDAEHRLHGTANLEPRLALIELHNPEGAVRVDFAASWHGDFAVNCLEFTTVLKQLYNLLDNAARHTADRRILVRASSWPAVDPSSVRFVVANALRAADRDALTLDALGGLWRGYSTTGSGMGLAASASLVAEAFGLEKADRAVDLGYVGSRVTESGYLAWLHWPIVSESEA